MLMSFHLFKKEEMHFIRSSPWTVAQSQLRGLNGAIGMASIVFTPCP